MSSNPAWLPGLVFFNGDWLPYLEKIYGYFYQDFVANMPRFNGKKLALKKHPMHEGKEATFWHMIQEGDNEADRIPDFRRCERIRWPKVIIENFDDELIRVWRNERRGEGRICIWFEQESYLVILAERKNYLLPWTAYVVEQSHAKRKLRKEYERWVQQGGKL